MRIKEIISQHRRDFKAIYECDHCEAEENHGGYDDLNFHKNAVPNMKCLTCGEKAGENYRPLTTKYQDGVQV